MLSLGREMHVHKTFLMQWFNTDCMELPSAQRETPKVTNLNHTYTLVNHKRMELLHLKTLNLVYTWHSNSLSLSLSLSVSLCTNVLHSNSLLRGQNGKLIFRDFPRLVRPHVVPPQVNLQQNYEKINKHMNEHSGLPPKRSP